jgi:hypothetical protein
MVQYSMRQNDDSNIVPTSKRGMDNKKQNNNNIVPEETLTPEEEVYRNTVIPLLLVRAYHLPNQNWFDDWKQYMCNNHPVLGISWYHKYHPIRRTVRIISLIGSMLFGLAITNIIYLAFVFSNTNYDKSYIEVKTNPGTGTTIVDSSAPALSVTNGNIALWTIGATLHASFDNLIWSLAACSCCSNDEEGLTEKKLARYRSTGVVLVVLSVIVATALATFAVALRAAISSDDKTAEVVVDPNTVHSYGLSDDNVQLFQVDGANDFEFIIAYFIELVLNYFIYYPLVGTILFSGILTCGRYGVFGGRPYEMKSAANLEENNNINHVTNHNKIKFNEGKLHPQTTTSDDSDIEQPKPTNKKNGTRFNK